MEQLGTLHSMPNVLVVSTPSELKQYLETEVGISDFVTVDQERIASFAEITEDWQWIHTDRIRAAVESPLKATVAHGFLTLSLLSRFLNGIVEVRAARSIVISGLKSVRFIIPVVAGSRVRGRARLSRFAEAPGFVIVVWHMTVECENGRAPAVVADLEVRYYSGGP
jgi:acyl dehydratase